MSLLFNQTCLNERLLPQSHTHTHTYIYIYIYIYIYSYETIEIRYGNEFDCMKEIEKQNNPKSDESIIKKSQRLKRFGFSKPSSGV